MRRYYAYIRVSTTKQGERGSSLQEQRAAIEVYARRFELPIEAWFEEKETAATRGRSVFNQMLAGLNRGKAHGVIIHKIDRSARNLRDWADLGELIDRGIDVHFAHESLDLTSRGGRLSADIQAVVASDYIRNLRDEVRKGFYGRLKQGLFPLPAPLGYRNEGGGKPKSIDPVSGPLVRLAFQLYATGQYNQEMLCDEIYQRGLRTRSGSRVSKRYISEMLNNEFYIGIIRIKKTNERFQGIHEPLVSASVFERVKSILSGRTKNRGLKHVFLYQKTMSCNQCMRTLIPEFQKGHAYYRCHTKGCKNKSVREELLDGGVQEALANLVLTEKELEGLVSEFKRYAESAMENRSGELEALRLKLSNLDSRLARLTDAYVDHLIEKDLFQERKAAVLKERALTRETLANVESGCDGITTRVEKLIELLQDLQIKENLENSLERRDLIKSMTSNLRVEQKSLVVTWKSPLDVIALRHISPDGGPSRNTCRTKTKRAHATRRLASKIIKLLTSNNHPNVDFGQATVSGLRPILPAP